MTIRIELVDVRARQLLEDLAKMDLIKIYEDHESEEKLANILARLRRHSDTAPDMSEIREEVDIVRKDRYERND